MKLATETPPSERRLLLADPNLDPLKPLVEGLTEAGFAVQTTTSASEAMKTIEEATPAFAIFALRFAEFNGLDLLKATMVRRPDARVVIITMYGDIPTAVAAMKLGAVDYHPKPVNVGAVVLALLGQFDGRDQVDFAKDPQKLRAEYIEQLYGTHGGNISAAARRLGMHRRSLQRHLKRKAQ